MPSSDRIDELKKRYDENPRRFFASLANEYRKAGDLEQAISLCQAHLAEQPANMNGHVVYGQALYEAGRYDESKVTFETALDLDPENLIALRHLGDIACTNGANDQARAWYERVLDADPRNEEIIALLAHLEAASKRSPADGPVAAPESVPPREAPGDGFRAPQVITPPTAATPIVPIESVGTAQVPVTAAPPVSPEAPVGRESLGLMDLSIDFGATVETPPTPLVAVPDAPDMPGAPDAPGGWNLPAAADVPAAADEFPHFDDIDLDAPGGAPPPAAAPAGAPDAEPLGDLMMDPFAEPAAAETARWNSPAVESAARGAAEDMLFGDSTPAEPAPPFVTETMAELYLQQGFTAEALEVYRQLSAQFPDDENLKQRVHKLEHGDRSSLSLDASPEVSEEARGSGAVAIGAMLDDTPPTSLESVATPVSVPAQEDAGGGDAPGASAGAEPATARGYFAGLAGRRVMRSNGRSPRATGPVAAGNPAASAASAASAAPGASLDALFGGGAISSADEAVALAFSQVAGAVGAPAAAVKGKPTAPAATELSLDSVFSAFREGEARPGGTVTRQSQNLRFDQFFATGDEASSTAPAPATAAPAGEPGSPAELKQFQSWLQGLKKP